MKTVNLISFIFLFASLVLPVQGLFSQDNTNEFLKSIMQGDAEEVEGFIEKGIDINIIISERQTPLMYAIWGNHPEIVKLLVSKGADVNLGTAKGDRKSVV